MATDWRPGAAARWLMGALAGAMALACGAGTAAAGTAPFVDVPAEAYYREPVDWAWTKGWTTGVGGGDRFEPHRAMTRAELVTMLHRAAGQPAPAWPHAFADVPPGSWFDGAVAWAAGRAITTGTSPTTFAPTETVTRAQAVTFLRRVRSSAPPPGGATPPFTDVPAGSYFGGPVAWAAAHDIAQGVGGGRFDPYGSVTRAQAVTFLQRYAYQFGFIDYRRADALAFFRSTEPDCRAHAAELSTAPPEPHRFADATAGATRRPGLFEIVDGAGDRLLVDLNTETVYATDGPGGILPHSYSFGCPPELYLGGLPS